MSRLLLLSVSLLFLACASHTPNLPLKNTYWSLIELNGQESLQYEHQPDAHLLFHINDKSLHGSDGCNQVRGHYTQEDGKFHFHQLISTRLACAQGMQQAHNFLQALEHTDGLKIEENLMFLYQNGQKIAVFEAKEDF